MQDIPRSEPVVTEEPYCGWQRWEVKGNTPYYKSPFPRTTISSMAKLKIFLTKEKDVGRCTDVDISKFSFKRRLGLRERSSGSGRPDQVAPPLNFSGLRLALDEVGAGAGISDTVERKKTVVELLTRDPEVILDHKKMMSKEAKKVDAFRAAGTYENPDNFEAIRVSNLGESKGGVGGCSIIIIWWKWVFFQLHFQRLGCSKHYFEIF